MYNECDWYSTKSKPPKNAALNMVVANCEMPPPKFSANTPSSMTWAVTNPLDAERGPMVAFTEKVSPGRITTPRSKSAMWWMFFTRSSPGRCLVVNDATFSFTPNSVMASVLSLGSTVLRSRITGPAGSVADSAALRRSTDRSSQHV